MRRTQYEDVIQRSRISFCSSGSKQITSPLGLNWAVCGLAFGFLHFLSSDFFLIKYFCVKRISCRLSKHGRQMCSSLSLHIFFLVLMMWEWERVWCPTRSPLKISGLLPPPTLRHLNVEMMENWKFNWSYYL